MEMLLLLHNGSVTAGLKVALRDSLVPFQRNRNPHSKTLHKSLPKGEANIQKFELGRAGWEQT